MKGLDIILLRHCQAVGQEADAPLTENGRIQAEQIAEKLASYPIGKIVSSPFLRAVDSVKPLAERIGLDIEIDVRLRERDLGAPFRIDWRDLLKHSFEDLSFRCGEGETSSEAMDRGREAIQEAIAQEEGRTTVIATHGNLFTLILRSFDSSYGFDYWSKLKNPSLSRLSLSSTGEVKIEHFSDLQG
jgi:2,3-bisphosphoglycerate-dependent phosphoglycerate mutase